MTARKKKVEDVPAEEVLDIQAALQALSGGVGLSYCDIDSNTIGRLLHTCTELGGMVTFWHDSNNKRLCYSVRVAGQHKTYNVTDAPDFILQAESLIGALTPILLSRKKRPPNPPTQS